MPTSADLLCSFRARRGASNILVGAQPLRTKINCSTATLASHLRARGFLQGKKAQLSQRQCRGAAALPMPDSQWLSMAPAASGLLSTPTMPDSASTGTRLTNDRTVATTYTANRPANHWMVRGAARMTHRANATIRRISKVRDAVIARASRANPDYPSAAG